MVTLLTKAADRLLERFAPRVDAAASCYYSGTYFCACYGGVAYRKDCYFCDDDFALHCGSCFESGAC